MRQTPKTATRKLIESHLLTGRAVPGEEMGLRIDQTLTQDATGTLVMLELEALGLVRAHTEASAQYVDHNLLQEDHRNPDDHVFLYSACRRFGLWYSPPGNGVSHPLHMSRLGKPTKTLLGSDSHTCAAGAIGMLAMGAGGIEVALAIAGEPFFVRCPEVWGVRLTGRLPEWVSAKDVVLEMLRRHGVSGGLGRVIEYYGPGLEHLSVWDRHVIANMGAELGATTTVFPSDSETLRFFEYEGRPGDWRNLAADAGASYDVDEEIDLSELEPLVAKPSSPGNVVPVREVAGTQLYQAYVGSSANPGYRDFAIAALIAEGKRVPAHLSFDINPTSRALLEDLMKEGLLAHLIHAGARLHQAGCNGCIGMGQAPATGRNSLRTVPRNFPGRSGTKEDSVWLCSPETAAASALRGVITDPRSLKMAYPKVRLPNSPTREVNPLVPPPSPEDSANVSLEKGPNIGSIPQLDPLPDELEVLILLQVGDDISTDEIMPAGARVLPYRSNIEKIAEFCFDVVDDAYPRRAREHGGPHAIVAGKNYGQGSSREHAALAPRHLGLRLVLAKSFARIHWQNLISFGVLPLTFADPEASSALKAGKSLRLENLRDGLARGRTIKASVDGRSLELSHEMSSRQVEIVLAGGVIPWKRAKRPARW